MAPQAVQRQIDDPGERHAGKNHLHGGERLERVFHGDHAAAPRCIAQDQQRHQHVLGYGHGSLLKVPAGCERTGYHDVSTDFRWLCPTNLMQMRHFCKNGKMKGMGAERGKTQNAAVLFRKTVKAMWPSRFLHIRYVEDNQAMRSRSLRRSRSICSSVAPKSRIRCSVMATATSRSPEKTADTPSDLRFSATRR
jgi:hypothetical protein